MRAALAVLVLGVGVAAAVWVAMDFDVSHYHYDCPQQFFGCTGTQHPSWAIPLAVLVGFVALAAAVAVYTIGSWRSRGRR